MYRSSLPSRFVIVCAVMLSLSSANAAENAVKQERPNILWLFAEDTSPWMGCYGDEINRGKTPNIDSLAARGIRFSRAFVPAPVCSACRSAMMGGQNQIRFNAHEHRSSRGPAKLHLPKKIKLLPQLMKDSGYFTFNLGKTDYNFVWDESATYSLMKKSRNDIPWNTLKKSQPFFGQIQTAGGKNNTTKFPADRKVDPSTVTVPPDYPQNELYHKVVAQHYDAIRKDDDFIGTVLDGLKKAGLDENTIIVYFGDHGANNLVRHKQMPTEGGLHVPFIISGSQKFLPAPSVRDDLVNMLDLSATTLAWGQVKIPDWYEGQFLFGDRIVPRSQVFAAKDRLDHTIDRVRTVRTDRFRYTRNFKTDRIFLQPQYRDSKDYVKNLRELYATGKLSQKLTEIYFGERPAEELYDVRTDPSQVNNLANDPAFKDVLQHHRQLLNGWIAKGDDGKGEESKEELKYQAQGHKWGTGVNPEYEVVRDDSDGDGLSDQWEQVNNRDPRDGKYEFYFDCGGWQTEGWSGNKELGNIAGNLGVLEFDVAGDQAAITREGLRLDASKNQGTLRLRIQASNPTEVQFRIRPQHDSKFKMAGQMKVGSGKIAAHELSLGDAWTGEIESTQFIFHAPPGTNIQIDSIEVR